MASNAVFLKDFDSMRGEDDLFGYLTGMKNHNILYSVNGLPDIVGGHVVIGQVTV